MKLEQTKTEKNKQEEVVEMILKKQKEFATK